ncbi:uncharacterized protein LOC143597857 [Bidens hawaiensis]|uniref:uncharacterized protein LOC143597857 n=1 Tax=Bidens hawaiensis TaxID=980011 RepID=UPI0040492F35
MGGYSPALQGGTSMGSPGVLVTNVANGRLSEMMLDYSQGSLSVSSQSPSANDLALTWNNTEGAMKLSKLQKEEARITAWENLQNAKAEASIRKLEMKLEKKKSASLDKILNRHRAAQKKAEEMRRNMSKDVSPRNSHKFRSLHRLVTSSVKGCFHHRRS